MTTRRISVLLVIVLAMTGLVLASGPDSQAQGCPVGFVLLEDGETCASEAADDTPEPTPTPSSEGCVPGYVLDSTGQYCVRLEVAQAEAEAEEEIPCPPGYELDESAQFCVEPGSQQATASATDPGASSAPSSSSGGSACDPGYSLGRDGETCVADGPNCQRDEIIDDTGNCRRSIVCDEGFVLASDLLTCTTSGCADDELLSADGRRCLSPESRCPDGSIRPVGGACLVVETNQATGEVVVRCASGDQICQAIVSKCAEDRALGVGGDDDCEDPRGSCLDGDDDCTQANQRLIECALLDEAAAAEELESANEACDDLCPALHRLDDSGDCIEYLDPKHPCVSFGNVPSGVTTNEQLNRYAYLAGTGQCVTRVEFLRRLGNFEAAAGAEAEALKLLRETTSEYLSVEERLVALQQELEVAEGLVDAFREEAIQTDRERLRAEAKLEDTREQLAAERLVLKGEVVEFFIGGGQAALDSAIMRADSITDAEIASQYGQAVIREQVRTITRVEELEQETEQLRVDAETALARVETALEEARTAQSDLEGLVADADQLRIEQAERRNEEAALIAELREDKAVYARQLGIFEQASREITDILGQSEFEVTEIANSDGLFAPPVLPLEFGSGFGPRLHPILGYVRNHDGIDFSANFGEPIFASAPGIVQIAREFGGYGKTVVIDHGGGLLTLYAHQSVISVEPGEEVGRGDIIGLIGSTGLSTGPHLHFEVWVNGSTAVDPRPYFTEDSFS